METYGFLVWTQQALENGIPVAFLTHLPVVTWLWISLLIPSGKAIIQGNAIKCICSPNAKALTKIDGNVVIYTTGNGEPQLALAMRDNMGKEADIQNGRREPGVGGKRRFLSLAGGRGGITFKYKEIGGLNLDPNLQHKRFKVIAQFGTHSVTILYLEDEEPGNIWGMFPETNGKTLL